MREWFSRRLVASLGVALASALVAPGESSAQTRPFRGLFRSENPNPNTAQTLTVEASAYGGYDDNATAQQAGGGNDPRSQVGSAFGGGDVSLVYSKQAGRRFSLNAGISTATRYYPDLNDLSGGAYQGNANMSIALNRRTSLILSQAISYAPYYSLGLFPSVDAPFDPVAVANLDYTLIKEPSWQYSSTASIQRELGRKSSLAIFYERAQSNFTSSLPPPTPTTPTVPVPGVPTTPTTPTTPTQSTVSSLDFVTQGGGFRFTRRVTRYASLRLGYTYRQSDYASGLDENLKSHDIDVGVDYARSLSLSRRAVLAFGTGSSVIQTADRTFARVNGQVQLNVAISRKWDYALAYDRGLSYVNGIAAPVFADSLSTRLQGNLSRRFGVAASASYSSGTQATIENSDRFSTYSASTMAQFGLSRFVAAEVEYYYYYYDFAGNTLSPLGVVSKLGRHGVRGGFSFWFPILR